MPSDLLAMCRAARAEIVVPAAPLVAIRESSTGRQTSRALESPRRLWYSGLAITALLAAGAGVQILTHSRISFAGGDVRITSPRMRLVSHATDESLKSALAKLSFHALLPQALPPQTKLRGYVDFDRDGIIIFYDLPGEWRGHNRVLSVVLASPVTPVDGKPIPSAQGHYEMGDVEARWPTPLETIIVMKSTLTPAEFARMRAATLRTAGGAR